MIKNNSLLSKLCSDIREGINSPWFRATLFLLGIWYFPALPMHTEV